MNPDKISNEDYVVDSDEIMEDATHDAFRCISALEVWFEHRGGGCITYIIFHMFYTFMLY